MWGLDMAKPGAQEYLNSLLDLYASWGVDYIKVDDMAGRDAYYAAEVEGYRKAVDQCGRPIVLSLSPHIDYADAAGHVEFQANLWRISGDFWDRWGKLKSMFGLLKQWNDSHRPGCWPDADMIPFGRLRRRGPYGQESNSHFTSDEHYTLMTLWCIARSPLMFGGDMPLNDAFTESLITNKEALEVNMSGSDPKILIDEEDQVVWTSKAQDGGLYLGLFNLSDSTSAVQVTLSDLGIEKNVKVRDLWQQKNLGKVEDVIEVEVNAHGAVLLKLK
jgi:hypothetical protein